MVVSSLCGLAPPAAASALRCSVPVCDQMEGSDYFHRSSHFLMMMLMIYFFIYYLVSFMQKECEE
jgi:thiosulfate reductase cytochrome b subunit